MIIVSLWVRVTETIDSGIDSVVFIFPITIKIKLNGKIGMLKQMGSVTVHRDG